MIWTICLKQQPPGALTHESQGCASLAHQSETKADLLRRNAEELVPTVPAAPPPAPRFLVQGSGTEFHQRHPQHILQAEHCLFPVRT